MELLEVPAIAFVIICVGAVVVAKVMTTSMVRRMRRDIARAAQVKKESLGRLKQAQAQTHVAGQKVTQHQRTKRELTRRISSLRKELRDITEEERARRQRTDARRVT